MMAVRWHLEVWWNQAAEVTLQKCIWWQKRPRKQEQVQGFVLTFLQLEGNRGPLGWWCASANVKVPPRSFSLLCVWVWCPSMASDAGKILPMLLPLSHKIMFLHMMFYGAFCCVWFTACSVKWLLMHNEATDGLASIFKLDTAADWRLEYIFNPQQPKM